GRPAALLLGAGAIPFLGLFGMYARGRRVGRAMSAEFTPTLLALSLYSFLFLQAIHAAGLEDEVLLDGEVFAWWLLGVIGLPLVRAGVRRRVVPRVGGRERTIIVGAGRVGQNIARKLLRHPELSLEPIGFVDSDPWDLDPDLGDIPVLGPEDSLVTIAALERADRIILTFSRANPEQLIELMRWSDLHRIHVTIVPNYFEVLTSQVEVDDLNGIPVLDLRPARLSRAALATKRATDLVLTILALPLLVPTFLAIALAVKLDSRGPVFFRQPRTGRAGRRFLIYKFRTMVPDAELQRDTLLNRNEVTGPLFKIKDDPRVTRVGRFLRRTSLDELPQLINVLKGEMSLVGPRPFVVYEDEHITGWARRRLDLTPGITGLWQVMGRNDMPFDEMVKLDHLYATRWSLLWDINILLKTIPSVLRRRGAY
ncbi:MAG: sugar transferase, partial [Actinomycetota bacterium]